jgi:hypothetical protein
LLQFFSLASTAAHLSLLASNMTSHSHSPSFPNADAVQDSAASSDAGRSGRRGRDSTRPRSLSSSATFPASSDLRSRLETESEMRAHLDELLAVNLERNSELALETNLLRSRVGQLAVCVTSVSKILGYITVASEAIRDIIDTVEPYVFASPCSLLPVRFF